MAKKYEIRIVFSDNYTSDLYVEAVGARTQDEILAIYDEKGTVFCGIPLTNIKYWCIK